ncbi:hypothetical protein ACIXN4_11770 [Bacteroides fragilis]
MHFIKGWALLFSPDLLHGTPLGNHIKDFSFFSYQSNEAGEHIRCHIIDMAKVNLSTENKSCRPLMTWGSNTRNI